MEITIINARALVFCGGRRGHGESMHQCQNDLSLSPGLPSGQFLRRTKAGNSVGASLHASYRLIPQNRHISTTARRENAVGQEVPVGLGPVGTVRLPLRGRFRPRMQAHHGAARLTGQPLADGARILHVSITDH